MRRFKSSKLLRVLLLFISLLLIVLPGVVVAQGGGDVQYPITIDVFLTVAGMGIFAAVFVQWVKQYAGDWRWTQLVTMLTCLVLAAIAVVLQYDFAPPPEAIWTALMIAFFGASVATFGYETVANLRGAFGAGTRSEKAINDAVMDRAEILARNGYKK